VSDVVLQWKYLLLDKLMRKNTYIGTIYHSYKKTTVGLIRTLFTATMIPILSFNSFQRLPVAILVYL